MTQQLDKSKPFPTIIMDNFFEDPYKVIELANSLDYFNAKEEKYRWPGKRSTALHKVDYDFFNNTVLEVLGAYFPGAKLSYKDTLVHFQKISSIYEDGWTHADTNAITFIIYLNDSDNIDGGTSICIPKNPNLKAKDLVIHSDKKIKSFKDSSKIKKYEPYRLENNNNFKEATRINNLFNRCVAFDAGSYHKANGFNTFDSGEDRLTLIGFIYKFSWEY